MMQPLQFEGVMQAVEFFKTVSTTIPSTATGAGGNLTLALPANSQALPGDIVNLGAPAAWANFLLSAVVSVAGTIVITYRNDSGSTINAGAQVVSVLVERLVATGM